ncbi:MAG TPA: LLM class F420-dependent oxidoreductase [Acidimicrobiales bacterium]|nr:LLM class F420-dependent oxidoreductase [Acidimicrobiales bacterium]
MRFGLHALGIGSGADPAVITAVGRAAEEHGFATLWAGEHVVMVDLPDSVYPYSDDGRIALPSDVDWLDPLVLLGFLASATSRIRLATGILLLPEHNPVVVAKAAATIDVLSQGRLSLGVGVGWSAEEFAALGVPFAGRAARTTEYVEAMRVLWGEDVASYSGPHVRFEGLRCYPKPVRRGLPVLFGGNSERALRRVATHGDGWYGFNVSPSELPELLEVLRAACEELGRRHTSLDRAVALRDASPADLGALEALGVDEVVVVGAPPGVAEDAAAWVGHLADTWGVHP